MRMVKMKQNHITLEACVKKFLLVKEAPAYRGRGYA